MARSPLLFVMPLLVSACASSPPPPATTTTTVTTVQSANPAVTETTPPAIVVQLSARSGSAVAGRATFTPVNGGVRVKVEVTGAPPGEIATHVHENGDCSAPDAKSAGSHFNPASKPHGLPPGEERHLGDLGNITVKADGTGSTEVLATGANLKPGDPNSFLSRAIIVHGKKDDGGQPVGNAGDRIACGVIRQTN